jgi:putative restriction endonuclease
LRSGHRLDHLETEPTRRFIVDFHGRPIAAPRDERFRPDPELLRRKIEMAVA